MTTSTRIIYADTPKELLPICKAVGYIRADIWRRYGGLKTARKTTNDIRNEISSLALYSKLPIDGTIRNESTKDIVNDAFLYRAAPRHHSLELSFRHILASLHWTFMSTNLPASPHIR